MNITEVVRVDRGADGVTVASFGVGFELESTVRVAGRVVRVRKGDRLIILNVAGDGIDLEFSTPRPAGRSA
jgi:hypothetical protein